ncbi:putative aldouronate transport system permease protein [Paenibacillus catalpae]|uniref:Putative aldouronate transport system permease protein n=1 Tax=Paenibacillus catalpae TaxID=1045775 RepID=A0A1I2BSY0_9BACL|nr:carbohydrate ABC transporter permease [Paenibacillus catalpae]SFE59179.1 putative aldouronate transport system permease protein [Paenibacillus catalpae]
MSKVNNPIFEVLNYLIQILFVLICLYPFYYIFIYSISSPQEAIKGVYLLPTNLTLSNYSQIMQLDNISWSFLISMLRTIVGTLVTVFSCALCAYIVTKQELHFRKIIYRYIVITMYFNAGLIPWYITMKMIGLQNNFLLYVLPSAVGAFYIILLKTFIEQLPASLEESAMLDGANYFTIFRKIVFPLSMPIIATIAVFSAVSQWNSWTDNYFLVSDERLQTLQMILYNYLNEAQILASSNNINLNDVGSNMKRLTPESIKMTITMIVTVPIMLVYPFLQRYFVKGLMLGAIKG